MTERRGSDQESTAEKRRQEREEVPRGALDLMVLQTLAAMGALHGYGIARRIEQVSDELLSLNQGTLYPALVRLEQRGWIAGEWGTSENHRRARYYRLTPAGRRQLEEETASWQRIAAMMARFLRAGGAG